MSSSKYSSSQGGGIGTGAFGNTVVNTVDRYFKDVFIYIPGFEYDSKGPLHIDKIVLDAYQAPALSGNVSKLDVYICRNDYKGDSNIKLGNVAYRKISSPISYNEDINDTLSKECYTKYQRSPNSLNYAIFYDFPSEDYKHHVIGFKAKKDENKVCRNSDSDDHDGIFIVKVNTLNTDITFKFTFYSSVLKDKPTKDTNDYSFGDTSSYVKVGEWITTYNPATSGAPSISDNQIIPEMRQYYDITKKDNSYKLNVLHNNTFSNKVETDTVSFNKAGEINTVEKICNTFLVEEAGQAAGFRFKQIFLSPTINIKYDISKKFTYTKEYQITDLSFTYFTYLYKSYPIINIKNNSSSNPTISLSGREAGRIERTGDNPRSYQKKVYDINTVLTNNYSGTEINKLVKDHIGYVTNDATDINNYKNKVDIGSVDYNCIIKGTDKNSQGFSSFGQKLSYNNGEYKVSINDERLKTYNEKVTLNSGGSKKITVTHNITPLNLPAVAFYPTFFDDLRTHWDCGHFAYYGDMLSQKNTGPYYQIQNNSIYYYDDLKRTNAERMEKMKNEFFTIPFQTLDEYNSVKATPYDFGDLGKVSFVPNIKLKIDTDNSTYLYNNKSDYSIIPMIFNNTSGGSVLPETSSNSISVNMPVNINVDRNYLVDNEDIQEIENIFSSELLSAPSDLQVDANNKYFSTFCDEKRFVQTLNTSTLKIDKTIELEEGNYIFKVEMLDNFVDIKVKLNIGDGYKTVSCIRGILIFYLNKKTNIKIDSIIIPNWKLQNGKYNILSGVGIYSINLEQESVYTQQLQNILKETQSTIYTDSEPYKWLILPLAYCAYENVTFLSCPTPNNITKTYNFKYLPQKAVYRVVAHYELPTGVNAAYSKNISHPGYEINEKEITSVIVRKSN